MKSLIETNEKKLENEGNIDEVEKSQTDNVTSYEEENNNDNRTEKTSENVTESTYIVTELTTSHSEDIVDQEYPLGDDNESDDYEEGEHHSLTGKSSMLRQDYSLICSTLLFVTVARLTN